MVRVHPDPPDLPFIGGLAQLGEHLLCKQGVVGSIPTGSTSILKTTKEKDVSREYLLNGFSLLAFLSVE